MNDSLYKIIIEPATKYEVWEYLLLDNALTIGEIDSKIEIFLDRKYALQKPSQTSWKMVEWKDVMSNHKMVKTAAKHNNYFLDPVFDNKSILVTKPDIERLSNDELRLLFTNEDINKLPIIPIRDYILQGKATFTMGERINEVENLAMMEVVNRFINNI